MEYLQPKAATGPLVCLKGSDFPKHHRDGLVVSFATFQTRVTRFGPNCGHPGFERCNNDSGNNRLLNIFILEKIKSNNSFGFKEDF